MEELKTEKIQVDKQRDVFITRTAIKTLTSEVVVERVISFQFKEVIKALRRGEYVVEVSGFGKFKLSAPKIRKRIRRIASHQRYYEKIIEECGEEEKKRIYTERKNHNDLSINFLEEKLNQDNVRKGKRDNRGVEEPPLTPGEAKGVNRGDLQGEDANM